MSVNMMDVGVYLAAAATPIHLLLLMFREVTPQNSHLAEYYSSISGAHILSVSMIFVETVHLDLSK